MAAAVVLGGVLLATVLPAKPPRLLVAATPLLDRVN